MINTKTALKQHILSSVEPDYPMGLRNKDTVFAGDLAWIMMDYLYTNRENVKYEDVVSNKHHLINLFDQFQTIFNLFSRYKDIINKVICTAAEV